MKIVLVSTDRVEYAACCDLLAEDSSLTFSLQQPTKLTPEAGIFLWDFDPSLPFPDNPPDGHGQQNLILVHRRHLPDLNERMTLFAGVILKPLTRAKLNAFMFTHQSTICDNMPPDQSRAKRDDTLQALMETNLRLQLYDHDRTRFLARAVHDFRAPLMALGGYCDLLVKGQLGAINDDQKEILSRMQHSARRLSRMASAMLQLSVGDESEAEGMLRPFDIAKVTEEALRDIAPLAQEKHVELAVESKVPPVPLSLDPAQIEQVIIHLLENACKSSPKFGRVQVHSYPYFWERRHHVDPSAAILNRRSRDSKDPNAFRVDITDSGPPLTPDQLSHIFDQYVDGEQTPNRSVCGLGLAVCRLILKRHSGTVWADNTPNGVTFSFVLPLRPINSLSDGAVFFKASNEPNLFTTPLMART